ncbi:Flavin-containing monooxygenase FMO GS-OX-like 2 [Dichanthelium oligosanthes]|uniref:Flavin-containing monooxygenase n=1 Tax=Dichanthelium oligosanthes TaxID=888268 RepID=A0A1E5URK7_9POAL|nr:Flavin-containing monooxygenase FMO GS-OX-like 2 [Dichanthelium oligosanthes]
MPRTVAVVGAGAAGLVAARELLREGLGVAVFEKSGRAGGTWAYDPRADDADPLSRDPAGPGAVHGSLYASLRTNLPRELMGFSGFPMAGRVFAGDARAFPGHREVLAFLDAFAEEHGVLERVRLRAEVLRVRPLGREQGERWVVAWRGEDGEVAEEVFDAVVVCNGHWTVPQVAKIRGIDNWRGKQMHSHNYRVSEPFRDQNVVVVGMGVSGTDIALEISHVAKEVHVASRYSEDRLGKIEPYKNVWIHREVRNSELFSSQTPSPSSSAVAADIILYCTGYQYHFPFLDLDGLTVDDNRVGPLYNHVFPPKYAPNLSFVGLPIKTIVFQSLELESKWVAAVLSGRATLPGEEGMMAAVREHYRQMEEAGRPKRHTHEEHLNWLADQVGEPRLEAWRLEMLEKAARCALLLDEGYRDLWEQDDNSGASASLGVKGAP